MQIGKGKTDSRAECRTAAAAAPHTTHTTQHNTLLSLSHLMTEAHALSKHALRLHATFTALPPQIQRVPLTGDMLLECSLRMLFGETSKHVTIKILQEL